MEKLVINWKPTIKQELALEYLNDKTTTEILFGGGAGGGKSFLGNAWLIISSLRYPGSRWVMARAILKTLKETTFLTFLDVCKSWNIKAGLHYNYNSQTGVVKWYNGSEIYLKDLFLYPSDPEFDELGSTEYTGGFIDEASQITSKAKNILSSRFRYKLEEFDIVPKLFIATNPSKTFLYSEFYKPYKANNLPAHKKFIQALVGDNPHISRHYIENLKKLDKVSKERLLYGNWEYDDDPSKMIEYDKIVDIFTNTHVRVKGGDKYITVDPARFGQDRTVIMSWEGFYVKSIYENASTSLKFVQEKILEIAERDKIPRSDIIVDEDGIGGGIVDNLEGVKGFVNNATPIKSKLEDQPNYKNLKAQAYFKLADMINKGQIAICETSFKELIIEDLEQVKRKDIDKDGKLSIVSKEVVKENIARSPDFSDNMMMRMFFEIQPIREVSFLISKA